MKVYTMDDAELSNHAHMGFVGGLRGLVEAGEMDAASVDRILNTYSVVAAKRGWLGNAFDRLFNPGHPDTVGFKLIKVDLRKA